MELYGEDLARIHDGGGGLSDLRKLFGRVLSALEPGGVFIFDVAEPGRGCGSQQMRQEGEGWSVVVGVTEDRERNILTRHIRISRRVGGR